MVYIRFMYLNKSSRARSFPHTFAKTYKFQPEKAFSTYTSHTKDPYTILGVSRVATAKEIKMAYFRLAKLHHPDMNPNDKTAKERFQQISAAYEVLSDESKRKSYDSGTYSSHTTDSSSGSAQSQQQRQSSYEDTFRGVQSDYDVILESWKLYLEDLQSDFTGIKAAY